MWRIYCADLAHKGRLWMMSTKYPAKALISWKR